MDMQVIVNAVLGVFLLLSGGLVKTLWDAVKELRTDIRALDISIKKVEVLLPTNYVAKSEHENSMQRIETLLARIDTKLDGKADKSNS